MYLFQWFPLDELDLVALLYPDHTFLLVHFDDFNRAFGAIVSATKEDIERDFAISNINLMEVTL